MKNTLYAILMVTATCVAFAACSSGDYNANPSSNANNSINPLSPLTAAQFTWSGTGPMSANINGGGWVAKNAYWYLDDTTGADVVSGINGLQGFEFYLLGTYAGHIYSLGHNVMTTWASQVTIDTAVAANDNAFFSYYGNSGEIQILQNDTSAIKALFYFQGVSSTGAIVNITNGYFNISKHP